MLCAFGGQFERYAHTEDELEEIRAKKEEMREQAELTAEAMKKAGVGRIQLRMGCSVNPATGLPIIGEFDTSGRSWGHGN
ncbi:hypothetical protein [Sulfurimonas sp.]|uniref:hypothetical protein n=1 Tax=Sulfurimonas sp. TaxID=2022749 RepID=UPI001A0933FB|nr:hypothetical protein [Sulfurimonas sp.]MBE0515694.1 hypothetical protein [Sulfurimonas sp.]